MSIHQGQPILTHGPDLTDAAAAMIMIHGRGAGAEDMLGLAEALESDGVSYLAPQASGRIWYPEGFMSPRHLNEPGISSAFELITELINRCIGAGVSHDRIMLLGFSQGACLVSDYAVRHPGRYGAVFALSGGLIGETLSVDEYKGSLESSPVFLGCSDVDIYIPKERVIESADILKSVGAEVTMRLYPGMPHTINSDEFECINSIVSSVVSR